MTALIMAMRPFPRLSSSWFLLWTSLLALLVGSSLSQEVLQEGDTVPNVKFFTRTRLASDPGEFEWTIRSSDDYFANKRVVLFALPGAFTPTCSAAHLPGYEDAYLDMRALGVDEVYCLSVNDAFVMRQWGLQQGLTEDMSPSAIGTFEKVKLIPDGAAAFTKAMGMLVPWDTERGFGERSWRYSMVVNNGVIEKMFVEQPMIPNSVDDPFEVSDAQTMLAYLEEKQSNNTGQSRQLVSHQLKPAWKYQPRQAGDRVPNVQFLTRTRLENNDAFDWKTVTTADYMAGKRVVLFALPGAFTPTCSVSHLPGYEAAYNEMTRHLGIDDVYCLSVNDAFVMRQWGLDQGLTENTTPGAIGTFEKVKLIPDGTAAFTRYMGMSVVWQSQRGFGERSWRYSMVVDDGVIEKIFIEPNRHQNSEADPFVVSDADTMLAYLRNATRSSQKMATTASTDYWKSPPLPFPEHDIPSPWTLPLQIHDKLPQMEFMTRTRIANATDPENPFDWKVRTTDDYFNNKRVVVFALPGAFTPTCSSSHLPEYEAAYDEIRGYGIDDVYCLSVNDAFVMRQWGLSLNLTEDKTPGSLGFTRVKLIPDGTAHFTRAMGMSTVWTSERGFGERSWRYSMVVNNGEIEQVFEEQPRVQNSGPDPYQVSDPQTVLKWLEANQSPLAHRMLPEWTKPRKEGDMVPNVSFRMRARVTNNPHDQGDPVVWQDITTHDLMAFKRVVIFALPGAFTPTCSASHLPGYEAAYDEIKSLGIDEVYCISVNDAFVMRQWGLQQGLTEDTTIGSLGFEKVKLIPDGSASFTRSMGMSTIWTSERGFGERSWRYSMVVNRGQIEKLFIEPERWQNSGPDPFVVSDADTMLTYLRSVEGKYKEAHEIPYFPDVERYPAHELSYKWLTPLNKGDLVPDVKFQTRTRIADPSDPENPFDWKVRTTQDYFAGKRVVVFAVPGAFGPVCSSYHLPEYEEAYDDILKLGIDDVYCISVNDAFVMRQWGLHQGLTEDKTPGSLGFTKVKLIPDGAARFTRGMGMATIWITNRGLGERSWRYSMVVDDGRIEQIFDEEPHVPNFMQDPYSKSTAKQMLAYLESNQPEGREKQTSTGTATINEQPSSSSSSNSTADTVGGQVSSSSSISKKKDALLGARDMIDTILDETNANPFFVRLAWRESGTFDVNVKGNWPAAGGATGSIRFEPEIMHKGNAGLSEALALLEPVKEAFPIVSYADLIQMASARGVELAGGPSIPMKYGRVDVDGPEGCSPEGNLPDAEPRDNGEFGCDTGTTSTKDPTAAGHLRKVFYRLGLSDEDIVALSGAHTFGRAYKHRSGLGAESTQFTNGSKKQFRSDGKEATYEPGGSSWTENWLVFDNSYFRTIPYKHADPELLKMSSDKAIFKDEGFRPFALKFRKSQDDFFASYARAHNKLSELGSKFDPPDGIVLPRKEKVKMVIKQAGKVVGHKYVYVNVDENNQVVENVPREEL